MVKTLTIERCVVKKQGEGNYGPWTLYDVTGRNGEGVALVGTSSFKDFTGETGEFEVTAREHPEYGTSYTIKKPFAGGGTGLGASIDDLRARIVKLEALAGVPAVSVPVAAPVPTPVAADDSIPF